MSHKTDAVTRWWRRISLRAKVTGVTVAVLALGLIVTGIGTMPILRSSLIGNVESQLPALVSTDVASRYFTIAADGEGGLVATAKPDALRLSSYFVAIYDAAGNLKGIAGGSPGDVPPDFDPNYTVAEAHADADAVLVLHGAQGTEFRASAAVRPIPGASATYTQVVALSLHETDEIITTYLGVFTTIALLTILVAALTTRGLVTLTFRRLGQVESTAMAIAAGDFSQRMTDLEPTTEVGRLNTAINTMLDRLDASIAQRDRTVSHMRRFIGDASHELRTPLVSVRGYAELYRMGAISGEEDTARAMERIEKEALRMGVLVEDLLALARLDEQRELTIEPLDLRPLAQDAALDLRAAAPRRPVTVVDTTAETTTPTPASTPNHRPHLPHRPRTEETPTTRPVGTRGRVPISLSRLRRKARETPPMPQIDFSEAVVAPVSTPPIVLGEENKVRQVIANLLGNARRFSADDAPIEIVVGADRHKGVGWFSIVDHGEGVPEPIREQIFQRFWRADSSRARETGGSGLGLAIVASIVQALQGSVNVTETDGGGATFTVELPLAPSRATPEHLLQDTQPIEPLDL
ncbi:HAMP domain-containing histidine kinase [Microbacterium resistens]|uniref:histidine kinase n=1 Tax=Microbacterium resistens TaxID=156977 RepID=A0ABY3RRR1_9MICO|nr:HAMP domain-containing sensor histidine kinase [Microbacterium resistens]MBW1638157.1 HAMP domain-containing histidine kinase [Microbacterium resistens]UGS26654.1 HAMP domain-containing histidine kinase [Microbacterium resistens]